MYVYSVPSTEWTNGNSWTPVTPGEVQGDFLRYFKLDEQCGFTEEPWADRMSFWDNLPLNENQNEIQP